MGNFFAKKEFKKGYHWPLNEFIVTDNDGWIVVYKKTCLLDRSTEVNSQVAHFVKWSLRLKNEFKMDNINPGFAGIGIVSSGFIYEATKDGFVKNEIISRLKELKNQNCIVAVKKALININPDNFREEEDSDDDDNRPQRIENDQFPPSLSVKLDEMIEKYGDFSSMSLQFDDHFLTEVLKRTKEILNHINRTDGNTLYDALNVFYDFFAGDDKKLQTDELCKLLDFLKLPDDMLAPYIREVCDELLREDPHNEKEYDFQGTCDILEKYEIIQQFELNKFEKESTFNCQFFLRVLHEIGMIDLRKNHLKFDEDAYNQSIEMRREQQENMEDGDELIDKNIPVEDDPEYIITDVNDLILSKKKTLKKVFCKGYRYAKERVLYMD
ncbi:unnamed protein product [Moneuplotes crassus]|uniref:Uncharacterized protein n=1 Tax=Euplotes crassus TaxID=5936 RepID=A0AAD1XDI4_EUPCR|nr:unnamed protein product [Moneuplotes crassus]